MPVPILFDKGLHNSGVFQQYFDERGIHVGGTERHGCLLKAMDRRVASEIVAIGREQVEQRSSFSARFGGDFA